MYDVYGNNIGYFDDKILYTLNGQCIGEVFRNRWIGKRVNVGYRFGEHRDAIDPVTFQREDDQETPIKIEAWEDSIFFLTGSLGLQKRIWDN